MINSLQQLFEFEGAPSGEFAAESAPICQHNIYKYSPVYVSHPLQDGTYELIFPESQLETAKQLCIEGMSEIHPYERNLPPMNPIKAAEGKGKTHYYVIFKPSKTCTIEKVLEQFYLSHVNSYNLDLYYNPLENTTSIDNKGKQFNVIPEAKLIPLTTEQVQHIALLHKQSSFGKYLGPIMNEIREIAEELKPAFQDLPSGLSPGDKFFWKMTTRSAKDSWFYKEQNLFASILAQQNCQTKKPLRKCEAVSAVDVVSAMIGSSRVSSDCESYLQWCVKEQEKNPLKIVIQQWVEFPEEMEFRCFTFNGKITAINQLCWSTYIDYLDLDKAFQLQIVRSVTRLHDIVKDKLPWKNYIMDIIYDKERDCAQICEFNPWGPYSCTGSQLFSWELDSDIILRHVEADDPVLRVLRPWMKVEEQFVLLVDKEIWANTSKEFRERKNSITQRCPCCRRKSDPKNFVLPPTTLYHPE